MSRIYVAGPMSGIPANNYPAFDDVAAWLDEEGWEVVNPADLGRQVGVGANQPADAETYRGLMQADIQALLGCDAIALLPEWHKSLGATTERAVADVIGLSVYLVERYSVVARGDRRWTYRLEDAPKWDGQIGGRLRAVAA